MNELVPIGALALLSVPVLIGMRLMHRIEDNPQHVYFTEPPPKVYAAIKRVLAGLHMGEHHYRIVMADPTKLTLRAVMEWRDRESKDLLFLNPQGYKLNQILLDVIVSLDRETKQTKVQFVWTIYALFFRGRVRLIQRVTNQVLQSELASMSASVTVTK
jgi:hypothetical protein